MPENILDNDELAAAFPGWPAAKILDKTGISERRIAAADETATDLAYHAATRLFEDSSVKREDIDFVILCTQASDHVLPTSACLLQTRLGLSRDIGALDVNLGCSGFVYCLSLAVGLIASGAASTVLVLTADTYSKYINDRDRSVRTLFGDGAAATVIRGCETDDGAGIGPFIFGTDGAGAEDLIVPAGGYRLPHSSETAIEHEDASGNVRAAHNLYMNGGAVMTFSLREVPRTYRRVLDAAGWTPDEVEQVVLHQANRFMLDALQKKLGVPASKVPRAFETVGNTVSSTIPFVLADLVKSGRATTGARMVLIGFGVGLSWAGAAITW